MVKPGQSFLDKTVQLTGSIDNVLAMAILNNVGITDVLTVGGSLKASGVTKQTVVRFFNAAEPATLFTGATGGDITDNDGIGFMAIEDNFIVG